MAIDTYLFTSESVSEGHPDKICDRISDAILDQYLNTDTKARVACETMVTTNRIIIAGEVRGGDAIDDHMIKETARHCVRDIGYEQENFHWENVHIDNYLHKQSSDIARGVDETNSHEMGAGDQGLMFGYACRETPEPDYMPAAIYYAHRILRHLSEARRDGKIPMIKPDSKSQITLHYEDNAPLYATSIVVSTQHQEGLSSEDVRDIIRPFVIDSLPQGWMCADKDFYVNPTGKFVIGGPDGDAGLTGRKIIVDTYGGAAPHGGGAFSGKDPTKVDRSAAYMARYLAKNTIAAGLADKCTIQIAYAIGVSKPLSFYVNCGGTEKVCPQKLTNILRDITDLSPKGICETLQLTRPIYERTTAYGHFGRTPSEEGHFSWEKTDLANTLKAQFS